MSSGALPGAFLEYSKVRGRMLHLMRDVDSLNHQAVLEEKKHGETYGQEISGTKTERIKKIESTEPYSQEETERMNSGEI